MKALCWHGKEDVRIDSVAEPAIEDPHDVIIRVTATVICGSDFHLYGGFVPTMEDGDILGHEFMGEVVAKGAVNTVIDKAKDLAHIPLPHPYVLQQIAKCCRKGGTLSVPGVYLGFINMFPMGTIVNKGLTLKSGQTHVQRYLQPLMDRILADEIDLSQIITHRLPLDDAPEAYEIFQKKQDSCVKVFLTP